MKLLLKMSTFLIIGILVTVVLDGYLSIQRDIGLIENSMAQRMVLLGKAVKRPFLDIWRTSGQAPALKLINDVNEGEDEITIRWIWDSMRKRNQAPEKSDFQYHTGMKGSEGIILFRRIDPQTEAVYIVGHIPIATPSGNKGWIELVEDMNDTRVHTWRIIRKTSIVMAVTLLLYGLFVLISGFFIIGRRLERLKQKAELIGKGDLEGAVDVGGSDELSDLAEAMNRMRINLQTAVREKHEETEARLAAIDQLYHADRLRTIGTLASGIAHEIGTPVAVMSGRAGIIMSGNLPAEDIGKNAEIIKDQANRITSLINQLLDFARIDSSPKKTVDIRSVLRQTIELVMPMLKKGNVAADIRMHEEPIQARINIVKIQQIVTNLITNAIQSMPGGGKLEISAGRNGGRMVFISIRDHGVGIPAEMKPQLFDPFFSTKESGKGTGLGLSIVQSIVREHSGRVDVWSEVGQGSCFTVYLPEDNQHER